MSGHAPFAALLLLTALAVLVPVLVSRITIVRLPVVVGEILAGTATTALRWTAKFSSSTRVAWW